MGAPPADNNYSIANYIERGLDGGEIFDNNQELIDPNMLDNQRYLQRQEVDDAGDLDD